jgi:hypothetical protein
MYNPLDPESNPAVKAARIEAEIARANRIDSEQRLALKNIEREHKKNENALRHSLEEQITKVSQQRAKLRAELNEQQKLIDDLLLEQKAVKEIFEQFGIAESAIKDKIVEIKERELEAYKILKNNDENNDYYLTAKEIKESKKYDKLFSSYSLFDFIAWKADCFIFSNLIELQMGIAIYSMQHFYPENMKSCGELSTRDTKFIHHNINHENECNISLSIEVIIWAISRLYGEDILENKFKFFEKLENIRLWIFNIYKKDDYPRNFGGTARDYLVSAIRNESKVGKNPEANVENVDDYYDNETNIYAILYVLKSAQGYFNGLSSEDKKTITIINKHITSKRSEGNGFKVEDSIIYADKNWFHLY